MSVNIGNVIIVQVICLVTAGAQETADGHGMDTSTVGDGAEDTSATAEADATQTQEVLHSDQTAVEVGS